MAAFILQHQGCVVVLETLWPTKPEIFLIWSYYIACLLIPGIDNRCLIPGTSSNPVDPPWPCFLPSLQPFFLALTCDMRIFPPPTGIPCCISQNHSGILTYDKKFLCWFQMPPSVLLSNLTSALKMQPSGESLACLHSALKTGFISEAFNRCWFNRLLLY